MKGLEKMKKPRVRALCTMLLVIVALMLVAQPVAAGQSDRTVKEYTIAAQKMEYSLSTSETSTHVLNAYSGVNKIQIYWWGCNVYLSDATCDKISYAMKMGSGTSVIAAIVCGSLGVSAPAGAVLGITAALLGMGSATLDYVNRYNTGIILRLNWVPFPPYLILTGKWTQ